MCGVLDVLSTRWLHSNHLSKLKTCRVSTKESLRGSCRRYQNISRQICGHFWKLWSRLVRRKGQLVTSWWTTPFSERDLKSISLSSKRRATMTDMLAEAHCWRPSGSRRISCTSPAAYQRRITTVRLMVDFCQARRVKEEDQELEVQTSKTDITTPWAKNGL